MPSSVSVIPNFRDRAFNAKARRLKPEFGSLAALIVSLSLSLSLASPCGTAAGVPYAVGVLDFVEPAIGGDDLVGQKPSRASAMPDRCSALPNRRSPRAQRLGLVASGAWIAARPIARIGRSTVPALPTTRHRRQKRLSSKCRGVARNVVALPHCCLPSLDGRGAAGKPRQPPMIADRARARARSVLPYQWEVARSNRPIILFRIAQRGCSIRNVAQNVCGPEPG